MERTTTVWASISALLLFFVLGRRLQVARAAARQDTAGAPEDDGSAGPTTAPS